MEISSKTLRMLCQFYNGRYDFSDKKLLLIINSFDKLDNINLENTLAIAKLKNSTFIKKYLNENLLKLYYKIVIFSTGFITFLERDNLPLAKYYYDSEKIMDVTDGFIIACQKQSFDTIKWFCSLKEF